jgi:transposase-like protein
MTPPTVPLLALLRKAVEWFLQQWMEAEATQQIGAGPQERTPRTTSRNG